MLFTILPTNLRVPSSGNNPLRTVFGFLLVHSLENLCSSTSQKVAKYRTEPPCRTIALNRGHGKPHSTVTKCQGSMITLPTPTRERGVAWVPSHDTPVQWVFRGWNRVNYNQAPHSESMKPGQILATGLLFFLLFMPLFVFYWRHESPV